MARRRSSLCEFERRASHVSRLRRDLDCGHKIDLGERYEYYVAKVRDVAGLLQIRTCRYCS